MRPSRGAGSAKDAGAELVSPSIEICAKHSYLIKQAKRQHYTDALSGCSCDQKKLFRIFNQMTGRGRVQVLPPHTSLPDLLDRFGVFFDQKIETIRNKLDAIPCQDDYQAAMEDARSPVELIEFQPLTKSQVHKLLSSSASKTCSLDPICLQS